MTRRLVPAALASAALLLSACDRSPSPEKAKTAQPNSVLANARTAPAATPAAQTEEEGEVQLEQLTGVWRVTGVLPGAGAKFANDDPKIMGALMDVFPEQISWSYKPNPAFAPADTCLGPVSGLIEEGDFAKKIRGLLASARARLRAGKLSHPHQWMCGDGGSWGDDAEFQVQGEGQMAMRWPGDLTLLLQRIKRPASNPAPLPPSGAYEDR